MAASIDRLQALNFGKLFMIWNFSNGDSFSEEVQEQAEKFDISGFGVPPSGGPG